MTPYLLDIAEQQFCPGCGVRGRRVKPATLAALLKPDVEFSDASWRFCRTADCPTVYFSGVTSLEASSLTVPVGIKSNHSARPICYCFGHSAADIKAAAGTPQSIFQRVSQACRRGEDRCEVTNPQGFCCLGDIRVIETRTELEPSCCSC